MAWIDDATALTANWCCQSYKKRTEIHVLVGFDAAQQVDIVDAQYVATGLTERCAKAIADSFAGQRSISADARATNPGGGWEVVKTEHSETTTPLPT